MIARDKENKADEFKNLGTYAEEFGDNFQGHILAVMVQVPTFAMSYRSALDSKYFSSRVRQQIARGLLSFIDEFNLLPTKSTLVEHIRPNVPSEEISDIESSIDSLYVDDVSDWEAVRNKTALFGKTQAVINAAISTADDVEKGDISKVLVRTQEAMMVGEDVLDVGIDYKDTLDDREEWYRAAENRDNVVPTGLDHLDAALDGGPSKGELWVVVAPPKKGKTTMLVNIGYGALLQGYNVVHYTFEMRDRPIIERYDSRLMGLQVKMKKSSPHKYALAVKEKANRVIKGNLFVKQYPTRKCTVSMLRTHLSMLESEGFIPDLVIADYADIMEPESRLGYKQIRHEAAGIYEDLRNLADSHKVLVWTASQTGRSALDKDHVSVTDFAESFEKAAIVDGAIGLSQTDDELMDGRCRLFLAALRNSESGRFVECAIDREQCSIITEGLYDLSNAQVDTDIDDTSDGVFKKNKLIRRVKKSSGLVADTTDARSLNAKGSKLKVRRKKKLSKMVRP